MSFLNEIKYRRYVQGNFLAGPHRASEKCPKTPWEGVKKKAIPTGVQQRNILQFFMEYYPQNSTTYSQQKGRRGLKTGYMVQAGDEGP